MHFTEPQQTWAFFLGLLLSGKSKNIPQQCVTHRFQWLVCFFLTNINTDYFKMRSVSPVVIPVVPTWKTTIHGWTNGRNHQRKRHSSFAQLGGFNRFFFKSTQVFQYNNHNLMDFNCPQKYRGLNICIFVHTYMYVYFYMFSVHVYNIYIYKYNIYMIHVNQSSTTLFGGHIKTERFWFFKLQGVIVPTQPMHLQGQNTQHFPIQFTSSLIPQSTHPWTKMHWNFMDGVR